MAAACGKADALALVGIKPGVQQRVEVGITKLVDGLVTETYLAPGQHMVDGVVVAAERVVDGASLAQQLKEVLVAVGGQRAMAVEVVGRQPFEGFAVVLADADAHLALFAVVQVNRRVRGLAVARVVAAVFL